MIEFWSQKKTIWVEKKRYRIAVKLEIKSKINFVEIKTFQIELYALFMF